MFPDFSKLGAQLEAAQVAFAALVEIQKAQLAETQKQTAILQTIAEELEQRS